LKFIDGGTSASNENAYQKTSKSSLASGRMIRSYKAVLPSCQENHDFGCIQSVEVKLASETKWERLTTGAKFWNPPVASFTPNSDGSRTENLWSSWDGDKKTGLPPSGKVQVYDSQSHSHGGGSSYVVKAVMSGSEGFPGEFMATEFGLSINPVKIKRYDPTVTDSQEIFSVEDYNFPKDIEFRLVVKMGVLYTQMNSWFFGRVSDAQINLDSFAQTLEVRGKPSTVPVQTGYMPYPVPPEFKDQFLAQPNSVNGNLPTYIFSPSSGTSVDQWIKYKTYLNPRASYETEVWKIDASPKTYTDGNREFENCLATTKGVSGFLTTSATGYASKPPTWNSKDASLVYQVSGPEFLSDGTKNRGRYLLALRTEVASCLWRSDLRNAKATIEVTNGDDSTGTQIATTSISQSDGWLYFAATGFHFSAPVIKVKLMNAKMISIMCLKGKIKKTVTATNPKCPTGYKKKN
jgi:hypothetical protein